MEGLEIDLHVATSPILSRYYHGFKKCRFYSYDFLASTLISYMNIFSSKDLIKQTNKQKTKYFANI